MDDSTGTAAGTLKPGAADADISSVQLTPKTLGDLIRALRSNKGAGDKRADPRVGLSARAELILRDPETGLGIDRLAVRVRDVSGGGVGFLSPRVFAIGELFDLLLDAAGTAQDEQLACRVSYCRSVGRDLYLVGGRFESYHPEAGSPPGKI
jgi:hypothetical protein